MCHLSHCKTWEEANFKRANILIFVALSYNTHHRCLWKWDYLTNLHSTFPLVNFLFFLRFIRRHYHIGISADGIRFWQPAVYVRFINIGPGIYLLTGKVSPPNRYFFYQITFYCSYTQELSYQFCRAFISYNRNRVFYDLLPSGRL